MNDKLKEIRHEANCWGTDTHESKVLHEAADLIEKQEAVIADIQSVLDNTEELNLCNYDHDLVCEMNSAFIEIYSIIKRGE